MRLTLPLALLSVLLPTGAALAAVPPVARQAPPNPDFLAWRSNRTVIARSASGVEAGGYRPSPLDLRDVAAAHAARMATNPVARAFSSIPSRYDSRDRGWVSPVKNQGQYGTCWAHAAMASLESWVLKSEGATLDFSENNLVNRHGFDWGFRDGGNGDMATAYLLRWEGPVLEADDPYDPPASIDASTTLPPVRHVQHVRWLLPRTTSTDNDAIKMAVMDCGAVMTDMYYADGWRNLSTGAYYYPGAGGQNHAVTIVGWDDDYPVANFPRTGYTPPGNGAFIVKNSWGPSWGKEGYLYISYYDGTLARNKSYAFPSAEPTDNYGKVYAYDPLGAVGTMGYGYDSGWMANVFTATENEVLAAVGFYMVSPNTEYEVYVYEGCSKRNPRSGTLLCSMRGVQDHAGYVTLPLSQGVEVMAGVRFSVVVSVTSPDSKGFPLAIESVVEGYSSAATAQAGESFINFDPDAYSWEDVSADGANCCIKVYTQGNNLEDGRTLYVDAQATAANPDGLTWETAFLDLPEVVAILQEGDCVRVAPGVYSPIDVPVANVSFVATGGPSQTIIDGDFTSGCVSTDIMDWSVALEGFTLVNGKGTLAEEEGLEPQLYGGGALGVTLSRCVISNCTAEVGGGTYNCNHYSCLIIGNAAVGNGAYAGGVSLGFLSGCTVTGNMADSFCGGIDRDTFAKNSIVWGNAVADGTCPEFEDAEDGTALLWYTCTSAAPTYGQDDEENASVGVLVADPRFVDAEKGDYRLRASSPCLDLGSVEFSDVDICALDLAGNDRIQNGAPDLGAYEGGVGGCVLRLVSSPEVWYSGLTQEGELVIAGDLDWTATVDAAWVTGVTAAGSGDATVTYTLSANAASTARTAHLVVTEASGVAVTQTIRQAAQALPPSAAATTYGLFVGVDTYAIPGVSQLSGTVADAVNMRERFTRWGYCRAANAVLLTNALATVTAVRQALTNLAATAKVGDVVVFYQAGHGKQISDNDVAIVEHDALYSDTELATDLSRFVAGVKVVVMADTCHSGGLFREAVSGATFDLAARVRARMSAVRPVVRPTARAVARPIGVQATSAAIGAEDIGWLTAADVDEYSWEDLGGGGLFTAACLAGWQSGAADIDGDERVSFYELWRYAKEAAAARGTTAQCQNEAILCSVFAGVTDAATCETETYSTPVRVPFVWLDTYMAAWGYVPQANAAYSFADYAAAAERTKTTSWGKTIAVWQDYVAGTDPTKSDDVFRATIEIVDGKPAPSWLPRLSAAEEAKRDYRIYGKGALTEAWGVVTSDSRFFKVDVRMK